MTLSINMNTGAAAQGGVGVGLMTSAGNPWAVADALAQDLVNRGIATPVGWPLAPDVVQISADTTITAQNQPLYDGKQLEWTGTFSVTLSKDILGKFGCLCKPPASGTASIVCGAGATTNNATATLTRTGTQLFSISRNGAAADFSVTGS